MSFEVQWLRELTEVETKEDSSLGIMKWGTANAFPQTLRNLIDKSPAARSAVQRTAKFYKGGKFEGEDTIVSSDGLTLKDLVSRLADDYAYFNAFAIHTNYNIKGQVASMSPLRVPELRFNQFDELGMASKVGYHPNFGHNAVVKKLIANVVTKDKIKWINKFNPPAVVDQIQSTRKGISNYLGQVLYCSDEGSSSYPVPTLQAPVNFVLADIENSILVRKESSTGFVNTYLLKTMLSAENPNLIALEQSIAQAQGSRGSGKIITLSGLSENELNGTLLEPIASGSGSKTVMDNCVVANDLSHKVINNAYLIPPILSGAAESTGFSQNDLSESYFIFNAITKDGRDKIEAQVNRVLAVGNFDVKAIKLQKLTLDNDEKDIDPDGKNTPTEEGLPSSPATPEVENV